MQVGLFSLGIIPYINASIVLQLMSAAFPSLKKMQREDGPQGRARFQYYQKLAAFVFAIAQVRPCWSSGSGTCASALSAAAACSRCAKHRNCNWSLVFCSWVFLCGGLNVIGGEVQTYVAANCTN